MKVGSLVVCVKQITDSDSVKPIMKGKIYTVRDITKCPIDNSIGIYLEEIYNKIHKSTGNEFGYLIERFRELDTPTEIKLENILELEIV